MSSKKQKVIHFISDLDIGGTEKSLLTLLPALQHAFENTVCCALGHGSIGRKLEQKGIPVHYLDLQNRFDIRGIMRLYQLLTTVKPAIIVTYLIYADIVGRIAARLARVPAVVSSQRSSLHKRDYLRLPDRITSCCVDLYIAQTEHAKQKLIQKLKISPHKITAIPNPIDQQTVTTDRVVMRAQVGIPPTAIVITCVSNFRPGKGHATLLEAFEHLYQRNPHLVLVLIGDGMLKNKLILQTKSYASHVAIRWLGLRDDIPEILAISDIFVLPTRAEGMSNALLEAMAAGLPCIASNIPANKAVITNEMNGLLFVTNNSANLSNKIELLLKNQSFAKQLGIAARADVKKHHSVERIGEQWIQELQKLLV